MTTSEAGIAFIKQAEGFVAHVYDDNGKPAIGYGHDIQPRESFPPAITEHDADTLLRQDLSTRYEPAVSALVPADCTQGQFDALVSFCYNLGPGSLKTMLSHGWDQVPVQILRWFHAGGNEAIEKGLLARRKKEAQLFTS